MPGGRDRGDTSLTDPTSSSGDLESKLKSGSDFSERVTPAKLCIAVLIREYISMNRSDLQPQERTRICLLLLRLIQSPDVSCSTLLESFSDLPKVLLNEWKRNLALFVADGVGGLVDLKSAIEKRLSDPECALHRSSVVGIFFKRLVLYFDALCFSEVSHLFENFKEYYNRGMMEDDDLASEVDLEEIGDFEKPLGERTQAELYIARQVELLQSVEYKADAPEEIQKRVCKILESDPGFVPAHFLSYLNCLRVNEYAGAVRSLRMAFAPDLRKSLSCPPEELNREFRYAALNLAALHARFHHDSEALSALKEAIMLAQDANDHVCLQHALSWLYRIRDSGDKETLIRRCIAKSGELNLSYLTSLGIQSLSQLYASVSASPSSVMEVLTNSDVLNCQHSIVELITSSYAQKSAFWTMYGRSGLSCIVSQLLLNLDTSDPTREGLYVIAEAYVLALCNVARYLFDRGYFTECDKVLKIASTYFDNCSSLPGKLLHSTQLNIEFQRCLYRTSWITAESLISKISAVDSLEALFNRFTLSLERGDSETASEVKDQLSKLSLEDPFSPSDQVRFLILQAELFCLIETFSSAITPLTAALSLCKKFYMELLRSIVYLHLAHLQLQLGMPFKATQIAEENLPTILSHGTSYDCSRAYLLLAKCRVACSSPHSNNRRSELSKAINYLKLALQGFRRVSANQRIKDVHYMMARLCHALNLYQERNQAAAEFKKLDQQNITNSYSKLANML